MCDTHSTQAGGKSNNIILYESQTIVKVILYGLQQTDILQRHMMNSKTTT